MLIKTSDLEFDDRLKKEVLTLIDLGNIIEIRAVIQNNKSQSGFLFNHTKYKTYRILFRDLLPQRKCLGVKALEMYVHFVMSVIKTRPRIVWTHNIEMIGIIQLLGLFKRIGLVEKVVWDQHELPPDKYFKSNNLKKRLQRSYDKSDFVIAANASRLRLIKKHFNIQSGKIILNLPHSTFREAERTDLKEEYKKWCDGRQYLLTSGLENENLRYIVNICEAVLQFNQYCLIVIGPYSNDTILKIEGKTKMSISNKIFFTGMLTHDEIINLTDNTFASIIMYNSSSLNNKYCAPNRLYQAVARGVPVITGNNPPLKDFISNYQVGYAINSDGRNISEIVKSFKIMKSNREFYIENISKFRDRFKWEFNEMVMKEICLNKNS